MPKRECTKCRKPLAPREGVERFYRGRSYWQRGQLVDGMTPYYHCQACWDAAERARDDELDKLAKAAGLKGIKR